MKAIFDLTNYNVKAGDKVMIEQEGCQVKLFINDVLAASRPESRGIYSPETERDLDENYES